MREPDAPSQNERQEPLLSVLGGGIRLSLGASSQSVAERTECAISLV